MASRGATGLGVVGLWWATLPGSVGAQEDSATDEIMLGPSCVTADCHGEMAPGPGVHGPVNLGDCEVCHVTVEDRHEFRMARSGAELCGHCHELSLANVVHAPVLEGDCTGCHDPHRSSVEPLLVASPTEGLCQTCHVSDAVLDHTFLHGPVEAGMCILCHESHSSWNLHLTTETGSDLCMFCHGEEFDEIRRMRHVHEPINESCVACHDPHGAESASLTHESAPDLCFSCHEELEAEIATSRIVHGAISVDDACSNCHRPHGSPLNRLLRQGLPDLCLTCHDRELESVEGDVVDNIAALLETSEYLHGPVRNGACTACHDPHASQTFRRLARDYPERFYAPFAIEEYALCFLCHAQDAFLVGESETVTNFRDGTRNLHFVHVNEETRGRTCRACHEVHASNHPFHMRDAVPYGGWELPIGFELLADGGRCSPGCHEAREYRRAAVEIAPLREDMPAPDEGAPAG